MIKTLAINLGTVRAMQTPYQPGWYVNPSTGQRYYYDGKQWYVYTAGLLTALGYMNPAPKQVTLSPGDKLQVTLGFQYTGPAISQVLSRYAIGVYGSLGFSEMLVGTPTFNVPASNTPIAVTNSYVFTIPTGVGSNWTSIYVKIWGGTPDIGGSEQAPPYIFGYQDALVIVGAAVNITNFTITDFVKV